jgi:hypothetical protein
MKTRARWALALTTFDRHFTKPVNPDVLVCLLAETAPVTPP